MRIQTSIFNVSRILSSVLLSFFLCFDVTFVYAGDWPQWRGPDRTGVAADSPALLNALPDKGLKPLWKTEPIPSGREGGWGAPVIASGRVFLFVHARDQKEEVELPKRKYPWIPPDKRGHLTEEEYAAYEVNRRDEDEAIGQLYNFREQVYCFDVTTGKTLWKTRSPSTYTRFVQSGTITIQGEAGLILTAARTLRKFSVKDGKELWATRLDGDFRDEFFMSSVGIIHGVALVFAGSLFAVDLETGQVLWQKQEIANTHSSVAPFQVDEEQLAVVNARGKTICLEPKTGGERWRVESAAQLSTPVIAGDRLVTFGRSRKGGLRCFRITAQTAEPLWTCTSVADPGGSPVVVDDHVYALGERKMICVDLMTGEEKWSEFLKVEKPQYTSLFAADGKLYHAWQGLLAVRATPEKFVQLYNGKMNEDGLLADESWWRKHLKLDELEAAGDRKKALSLFKNTLTRHGALGCSNAAIADGQVVIRTRDQLISYDLRAR